MSETCNAEPRARRARSVVVVLNPAAGRGQGRRRKAELETLLAAGSALADVAHWEVAETTARGDATGISRRAAEDGADVVAAAGGDGTYGEVVNGIVGSRARLGILPLGTGNDFARGLGLGTDLRRSVDTLFNGEPRPLDLGRAGERWFVNVAGCGFDAVVALRVNRGFRLLRGTAAYVAAVLQSLMSFRAARLLLEIDGRPMETRAMLCSVANAPSYGGGMRVAPDARIDDGLFDICLLHEVGRLAFLRAFPKVFKGTHVSHPKVSMLRARSIYVHSDPTLPVLVDGDIVGQTPVLFTIHEHAIEVMAPRREQR